MFEYDPSAYRGTIIPFKQCEGAVSNPNTSMNGLVDGRVDKRIVGKMKSFLGTSQQLLLQLTEEPAGTYSSVGTNGDDKSHKHADMVFAN